MALSRETLRKWMSADGLWRPKGRREARVHPSRPRRAQVGDLVQVDGSPHDWFEGRGPRGTLIVFIDDAAELDLILCRQETRKLSKNLTFQFQRREHQLTGQGKGRRLRGAAVTVCQGFDGTVSGLHQGRKMAFRVDDLLAFD